MRLSLRGKNIIINQSSNPMWYIGRTYTIPKYIKRKWKEHTISSRTEKIRLPKHLVKLPISRGGLGISDIDTQLNSLKLKWIQRLLNPTSVLWKVLMLYRLNLILNSN